MKEITGELWDYYGKEGFVVCITTNGTIRKDGACVMGRGCAREAADRIKELPYEIGKFLKQYGNYPMWSHTSKYPLCTFPVKHQWFESASLSLIARSAERLMKWCWQDREKTLILPRPGCGNGRLTWEQVKPVIEFLPNNVWVISKGA